MVIPTTTGALRDKGIVLNGNYTVANFANVNSVDCDGADNTTKVLATLIADLIAQGIIKGTVTSP